MKLATVAASANRALVTLMSSDEINPRIFKLGSFQGAARGWVGGPAAESEG
jgi:hypothetical protein